MSEKAPEAFRTISEVAEELDLPQHVLRFWETRFSQIRPMKRGGGRRYYRPEDLDLLKGIKQILYGEGYTIKGAQRILKERGVRHVAAIGRGEDPDAVHEVQPPPTLRVGPTDPLSEYAPKKLRQHVEPPLAETVEPEQDPEDPAEFAGEEHEADLDVEEPAPEDADPAWETDEDELPEPPVAATARAPLDAEAVRALRAVLRELQDCRRILQDLRREADL
ncbi:MerR family transcriptional regulator [Lutibaculum baratangense]|uniref:Transcriptional regulator, MerR family n=1 Tax=Lutibaculum baratangense AMV1 TaxID=631454 RepID=V4RAS4_9HYPH|nr:MerR family transcriptional regulator [Lutibaculum baratangense]ESR23281.1 Transcriptional regulator, MerR family [Lutibaculum baratangense AMV1]